MSDSFLRDENDRVVGGHDETGRSHYRPENDQGWIQQQEGHLRLLMEQHPAGSPEHEAAKTDLAEHFAKYHPEG